MTKFETNKAIAEMQLDDAVEGFYLLKDCNIKSSSNGKPYLSGKIADSTGDIVCVFWGYDPTDPEKGAVNRDHVGAAVKIRGNVSEYNGGLQIVISAIRPVNGNDKVDVSRLVPVAPINITDAKQRINELVSSIQDKEYRKIAVEMVKRHSKFDAIPAAKGMHHAFVHGLLMHVRCMLETANFIANLYPWVINRDLLLTGTLCHDMAKEREFVTSDLGIVTDYSKEGVLLGHLTMGAEEIDEVGTQLGVNPEKILLLKHMILSHHGEPEWGACIRPQTAEAIALHYIDQIDAKMENIRELFETMEVGQMSNFAAAHQGRIYKHFENTTP